MKTIGGYRVLGLLGRGGMGVVYKVAMPATGGIVALKLLSPTPFLESLWGRGRIERAFLDEASTLASLSHPNVAGVLDFGRDRGSPYFVMDYFCRDLGQVIGEKRRVEAPSRRLALPRAAGYALQTLAGLGRLHRAGIVHRDIKPANLLLTDEDQVVITDFGLSKSRGESAPHPAGLKVGSPYYAAPEQEEDPDAAGPAADLYAVAVTLYRMVTGRLPAWPLAGAALPSALSVDFDPAWDSFFQKALNPDPKSRHQDARDMAACIETLLEQWKARLDTACTLVEQEPAAPPCPAEVQPVRPRTWPLKAPVKGGEKILGLDELGRPACYASPRLAAAGETVRDAATGLVWQTGGSRLPLNWQEARGYLAGLNAAAFGGRTNWRLPTVAELSSILKPPPEFTGHCLDPVFDPGQRLLWTADRRAFTQAWFADTELGAFSPADMTCRRSVRAVGEGVDKKGGAYKDDGS